MNLGNQNLNRQAILKHNALVSKLAFRKSPPFTTFCSAFEKAYLLAETT